MAVAEAMAVVVSTHSRLKAAGPLHLPLQCRLKSFNTQPPKGGWMKSRSIV